MHYCYLKIIVHDWFNANSIIDWEKKICSFFFFIFSLLPFEFAPFFTSTRKEGIFECMHFQLCFYVFNLLLIISFSKPQNYGLVLMLNFERDILKNINSFIFLISKNWTLQLYSFLSFILFYKIVCFKNIANRLSRFYSRGFSECFFF